MNNYVIFFGYRNLVAVALKTYKMYTSHYALEAKGCINII